MNLVPYLDKPAAFVGTTGAGKTYAAKGAVEALLAQGRRVVIIDPTGAWFGLRSGPDGDAVGGFPVHIFGGDHADIAITPDAGDSIAAAIAGRDVQAIIDVSDMTGGEKTRFLTAFLQRLYADNKAVLHLIVDEADEVCPQNPMPEERRLSGAFDKIVRRGRIKGFRPLMITQRPAVLHKNVLSQIGTLIALKLTSPQDRKAIEDWVKGNADGGEARKVMASLPTLKRGEGWVWSPADHVLDRVHFPPIRTFDSSRSPEFGESVLAPALTAVDVAALQAALTQKPVDAAKPAAARDISAEIAAAEQRGYKRGHDDGFKAGRNIGGRKAARNQAALIVEAIAEASLLYGTRDILLSAAQRIKEIDIDDAGLSSGGTADFGSADAGSNPTPVTIAPPRKSSGVATGIGAERKPLLFLVGRHPAGFTEAQWASLAGYAKTGGTWSTYRARLIRAGMIEEINGLWHATSIALDAFPDAMSTHGVPATPEARVAMWAGCIPGVAKMLSALLRVAPKAMSREEIAGAIGMTASGGTFNTYLGRLRANGLLDEPVKGSFRLSSIIMEN